jgi:hypothetical protein
MQTITQFVASSLGIASYPPPESKRGPRYGKSDRCWLCGGDTYGLGWPLALAIAPTFTQHNCAKCLDSDAVCQSCTVLTRAETWQGVVTLRKLPLKVWTQAGWHSYSHFVQEDGHYEAPVPSRVREILLDPPSGRWVLAINTSGKKHTIFRGAVASGRGIIPVQMDEETIWASHGDVLACLADFERLTSLGCRKDDVLSGNYHPEAVHRAGLRAWHAAEAPMPSWRQEHPGVIALVHFVARGPKFEKEEAEEKPVAETVAHVIVSVQKKKSPQKKKAGIEDQQQGFLF